MRAANPGHACGNALQGMPAKIQRGPDSEETSMKLARMVVVLAMALALLLGANAAFAQVTVNQNAPNWWGVYNLGQPVDYWYYWGPNSAQSSTNCGANSNYNCEVLGASTNVNLATEPDIHTPTIFYLPGGYNTPPASPIGFETANGGCGIQNNYQGDNIYYFNPSTLQSIGNPAVAPLQYMPDGTYLTPPGVPGFMISQGYSGAQGFTVLGQTGNGSATGSPYGSAALAVAYVTNHRCSNGNLEYGVYQDFTGNNYSNPQAQGNPTALTFYYSNKTNCSGYGECRSPKPGITCPGPWCTWNNTTPVYQATTIAATITNVQLPPNSGFFQYYSMYMITNSDSQTAWGSTGFDFRIQILSQQAGLATCTIASGTYNGTGPCTVDIPINNMPDGTTWSVQQMVQSATYLETGAQVPGPWPNFQGYPAFWVQGGWLGFNETGFPYN